MQHRAFDSLGSPLVSAIMFDIDRGCGSILLTDCMNAGRIAMRVEALFFPENLGAERTLSEGVREDGLRSAE